MSLTAKAIKYLQDNYPNFYLTRSIILRDDGEGPYVYYWGFGEKPTEAELNTLAENATPIPVKPTVDEALEMIYNDMKHGTKTYVNAMDAVKGVK